MVGISGRVSHEDSPGELVPLWENVRLYPTIAIVLSLEFIVLYPHLSSDWQIAYDR